MTWCIKVDGHMSGAIDFPVRVTVRVHGASDVMVTSGIPSRTTVRKFISDYTCAPDACITASGQRIPSAEWDTPLARWRRNFEDEVCLEVCPCSEGAGHRAQPQQAQTQSE